MDDGELRITPQRTAARRSAPHRSAPLRSATLRHATKAQMPHQDILHPSPEDIDFRQIAERLAQIILYNGCGHKPVSAAQHTLILCDALLDPAAMPWALLAETPRAVIGDLDVCVLGALLTRAKELSERGRRIILNEWDVLKSRHIGAARLAAGLPEPDETITRHIFRAGRVAMLTERRDFLSRTPRGWPKDLDVLSPLPRVYRLRAPKDVADDLYARFRSSFPALRAPALAGKD